MADEIKVHASLRCTNGNLEFDYSTAVLLFDQAVPGGPAVGMVQIGTSEETVAFTELTTEGWMIMQNLDDTNYVEWGFSTGVYGGRMRAGEPGLFRLNAGTTLYMRANTASCRVRISALES